MNSFTITIQPGCSHRIVEGHAPQCIIHMIKATAGKVSVRRDSGTCNPGVLEAGMASIYTHTDTTLGVATNDPPATVTVAYLGVI